MTGFAASRREWAIAVTGGLAVAALLTSLVRGDAPDQPLPVVAERQAGLPPPPVPPAAPATSAAPAAPVPSGLMLRGLIQRPDGAAAILQLPDGHQRLVRAGATVMPGIRLVRVAGSRAVLSGGTGEVEIGFPDSAGPVTPAAVAGDSVAWRLALEPVRTGGSITGWRVRDLARLPQLAAAGLKPGDVLTDIDGNALLNEERILALPSELAANPGAQLGYLRNGNKARIALPR